MFGPPPKRPKFRPWGKKRGGRTLATPFGSLATEAIYYTLIVMVGVFGLSLVLALNFAPRQFANLPQMPGSPGAPALQTPIAAWVFGTLFLAAILLGGGCLLYRLARESSSSEYRHVLASRANRAGRMRGDAIDMIARDDSPAHFRDEQALASLPSVPNISSATDSPGERLRYRLAPASGSADFLGIASLALIWNSAWFVLVAIAVSGLLRGIVRPFLIGLLLPSGLIGWWLYKKMISRIRASSGVGPTVVEISDHPLHPGENYDLFVSQWGRMQLRRLTVRIVCEEETFYRQGTDVRVERCQAMSIELGAIKNLRVDRHNAAEQQLQIHLPVGVMHSLSGRHNAIHWRIEVQGKSRQWPSFCRSFPVVVHPPPPPIRRTPR